MLKQLIKPQTYVFKNIHITIIIIKIIFKPPNKSVSSHVNKFLLPANDLQQKAQSAHT